MDIATLEASLAEAQQKAEEAGGDDEILNQAVKEAETALTEAKDSLDDPVKKELNKKKSFSRRERLNFEKRKIDEQLSDIDKKEGIERQIDADDDKPLTVGMLKKLEKERAKKTALELAEAIEDEGERELTKHYLTDRIIPSGDPQADLRLAQAAVYSLRNAEIAEEAERKRNPKTRGTPPGASASHEKQFVPTAEERVFMQPPYNLTKEDIIKARQTSE